MDAIKRTLGFPPPLEDTSSMVLVDKQNAINGNPGPPLLVEVRSNRNSSEDSVTQVKDRLISLWNNMKFSKTFWDSKKSISFSRRYPVWLLGQRYHKSNSGSRRSSCSSDEYTLHEVPSRMDTLALDFHSKLWMTYRKGFECFPRTNIDSDCGWGCMIRAGQMIVSNALIKLHLGRGWRWKCNDQCGILTGDDICNEALHRDIVRLFADQATAPLSIHKIVAIGQNTIQCKPGDWFGPGSTAHLFRQALDLALNSLEDAHPQLTELLNMRIYVAMDGTVYKQDVLDLGAKPVKPRGWTTFGNRSGGSSSSRNVKAGDGLRRVNTTGSDAGDFSIVERPQVHQIVDDSLVMVEGQEDVAEEAIFLDEEVCLYSLNQEVSVDGETWLTGESSSPPAIEMDHSWTPILLLVPVRLGGGEQLNPIYGPCVKALLANDLSVGIIGGRPRHALYFVGFQEENLIHLDPHLVQENVDVNRTNFPLRSFHCKSLRKMPLAKMDPSCCLGFLCRTRQEFHSWCDSAACSGPSDGYSAFSIVEGRASDHMADSIRLLNQMSALDDGDQDDQGTLDSSFPGVASRSPSALGTIGGSCSDSDDFVVL